MMNRTYHSAGRRVIRFKHEYVQIYVINEKRNIVSGNIAVLFLFRAIMNDIIIYFILIIEKKWEKKMNVV